MKDRYYVIERRLPTKGWHTVARWVMRPHLFRQFLVHFQGLYNCAGGSEQAWEARNEIRVRPVQSLRAEWRYLGGRKHESVS